MSAFEMRFSDLRSDVCSSDLSFSTLTPFFCVKHTTAYEMRISDWSSDVCSSDLQSFEVTSTNACMRSRSTTLQSRSNPPNASTASCTTRVQAACVPRSATPVTQPVPPFSRIRDRKSTRLNSSH